MLTHKMDTVVKNVLIITQRRDAHLRYLIRNPHKKQEKTNYIYFNSFVAVLIVLRLQIAINDADACLKNVLQLELFHLLQFLKGTLRLMNFKNTHSRNHHTLISTESSFILVVQSAPHIRCDSIMKMCHRIDICLKLFLLSINIFFFLPCGSAQYRALKLLNMVCFRFRWGITLY